MKRCTILLLVLMMVISFGLADNHEDVHPLQVLATGFDTIYAIFHRPNLANFFAIFYHPLYLFVSPLFGAAYHMQAYRTWHDFPR